MTTENDMQEALIDRLRREADIYARYDLRTHKTLLEAAQALATARAEGDALVALLRECRDKLGDIVMGEGLHPDDAVTLHAKISAALSPKDASHE